MNEISSKQWAPETPDINPAASAKSMQLDECYNAALAELTAFVKKYAYPDPEILLEVNGKVRQSLMTFVTTRYSAVKRNRPDAGIGNAKYTSYATNLSDALAVTTLEKTEVPPSAKQFVLDLEKKITAWATGKEQGAQVG